MSKVKISQTLSQSIEAGDWQEIERYFNDSDFAKALGIIVNLDDPANPRCEVNEIKDLHIGGVGQSYINGAVISAIFDLVIGLSALGYASEGNFATSNVNIRFVKPVERNRFYATSKVLRKIGNIIFSEATLFNFHGEPCGQAHGEIRVGIK
ncbi:PaaI family thioesterase [Marinobacter sp. chi1]|uniref:PaaI family thioesterase n=1 Tax=Marinobacter suaedae TaxID=3057675 RepID=A0ABT8W1P4_9GAMM|nr:PaaI family thioesterase [Marinobacter sp. chi1]MDO3722145.1 PaaI family thioesterase [Marinobacter sp. chi1]